MTAVLRIVLATQNAGKVRELAEPLAHAGVEVLGLDAFPEIGDIAETGLTFEENAYIKAATVARHSGLLSVADDSGLEVDALGGAPGVYSARYADDLPSLPGESRDAQTSSGVGGCARSPAHRPLCLLHDRRNTRWAKPGNARRLGRAPACGAARPQRLRLRSAFF